MTDVRRLALGTMMPTFEGLEAPAWLLRLIEEGLGAVALFARNVDSAEQLAALIASLREAREDLVIAIDEEAGDVTRLYHAVGSPFPGNRVLGHVDDPELTRAVGRGVGRELASVGINLDLAPIADTVTSPRSPLGTRSFSPEARRNGEHAHAWVVGLQEAGVAACLKHFPGLGASEADSHLALARVPLGEEQFETEHLAGFLPSIRGSVAGVMSAHVIVDAWDSEPTTLSAPVLTDLLRGRLGFEGVTVSDALEMHGVLERAGSLPAAAIGALRAGVDLLCLGAVQFEDATRQCVDAVVAAVADGTVSVQRLAEANQRVQGLGQRFPGVPQHGDTVQERAGGLAAARAALTTSGQTRGLGETVVVLDDRTSIAAGPVPWGPQRELALLDWPGTVRAVGAGEVPPERASVLVVRDLLLHPERDRQVARMDLTDTIVLDMGMPGREYPHARGVIRTLGASCASSVAALEVLTGESLPADLLPTFGPAAG